MLRAKADRFESAPGIRKSMSGALKLVQLRFGRGILPGMPKTTFRIIVQPENLFSVEMTPPSGKPRLIPDFRTRAEAEAWIVQTERMLHARDPTARIVG